MSEHVLAQKNIAAYVIGGLEPDEIERLERHLAECAECVRSVEEAKMLDRQLLPLFAGANPGPALEDRLMRVIDALPPLPRHRPFRLSGKAMTILGAAAAVLLACVGLGVERLDQQGRGAQTPPENKWAQNKQRSQTINSKGALSAEEEETATLSFGKGSSSSSTKINELVDGKVTELKPEIREMDVKTVVKTVPQPAHTVTKQVTVPKQKEAMAWNEFRSNNAGRYTFEIGDGRSNKDAKPGEENEKLTKEGGRFGRFGYSTSGGVGPGGGTPGGSGSSSNSGSSTGSSTSSKPVLDPDPAGTYFNQIAKSREASTDNRALPIPGLPPPPPSDTPPRTPPPPPGDDKPSARDEKLPPAKTSKEKAEPKKEEPSADPKTPDKLPGEEAPGNGDPDVKNQQPKQLSSNRKIIYTGDLEFEVQSFDNSLDTIKRLKGATSQIASFKKGKLPNGKVYGVIVLRVLPDRLDELVATLITELTLPKRGETKNQGELKSQHVFSEDVTKHYTDLESRLQAAKTTADRLNAIIKEGKGVIKDVLAAEKELGTWRTKIEEFEGELRYYANLVSMSTLTIRLYEKEIGNASQVTQYERVRAGIETEDVKAAYYELKKMVKSKGREIRSELKDAANAFVHFEVSGDTALNEFRDTEFKKLGTLSRYQSETVQQSDDGAAPAKKAAVLTGDTQFLVNIYSLGNLTPKETIILRLAVPNVRDTFTDLRLKIEGLQGLARENNAVIKDQERTDVSAQVDFDVNSTRQADIISVLGGETLDSKKVILPAGDGITKSRIRYLVTLLEADSLLPREKRTVKIVAGDVPASFEQLQKALEKIKKREIFKQVDKREGRFEFVFHGDDETTVNDAIKAAGDILFNKVETKPAGGDLTSKKVLACLLFVSADAVTPRETITLRIMTTDVQATFDKLLAEVKKDKLPGESARPRNRIIKAEVDKELKDAVLKGELNFEVPTAAAADMAAKLDTASVVFRNRVRAEGEEVSDAKVRFLIEVVDVNSLSISPREAIHLKIAAVNVRAVYANLRKTLDTPRVRLLADPLNDRDPNDVKAQLEFTYQRSDERTIMDALAKAGDELSRTEERNHKKDNVTDAKVLVQIDLVDVNSPAVIARETIEYKIAADDVPAAREKLIKALDPARTRITVNDLNVAAEIAFTYARSDEPAVLQAIKEAGVPLTRTIAQTPLDKVDHDKATVTDTRVLARIKLVPAATSIVPRESTVMVLEVSDELPAVLNRFEAAVKAADGRSERPSWAKDNKNEVTVVYHVLLKDASSLLAQFRAAGVERVFEPSFDPQGLKGDKALARFTITMVKQAPLVARDDSLSSQIHHSVAMSLTGLNRSFGWLAAGVLFVGPWLPVVLILYFVVRRTWHGEAVAPRPAEAPPNPPPA